ncbi:hypothetical protein DICVIV_13044 [Dictyocaulus viviparus]|uniref:Uncharacterized protein n=1 Tax=Dictyocaulus viviparus TaxID=29172 RepID=A0A0D8XBG0_DICVI|nr:hypothetical protein DICVIV_13044 [Dictyocaulus viviparus]
MQKLSSSKTSRLLGNSYTEETDFKLAIPKYKGSIAVDYAQCCELIWYQSTDYNNHSKRDCDSLEESMNCIHNMMLRHTAAHVTKYVKKSDDHKVMNYGKTVEHQIISNVIMAGWSTQTWQNVLNRVLRALQSGRLGSNFATAIVTIS